MCAAAFYFDHSFLKFGSETQYFKGDLILCIGVIGNKKAIVEACSSIDSDCTCEIQLPVTGAVEQGTPSPPSPHVNTDLCTSSTLV